MADKNKEKLRELVEEAMLRELAESMGKELAKEYGSNLEGITTTLVRDGVELNLHSRGFEDIHVKFAKPSMELIHDGNDDEL